MNAELVCEFRHATSAITTHASFSAIGVIILHLKVVACSFIQQHQPISADSKPAIAKPFYLFCCDGGISSFAIISDYKIVAGTLVFVKVKNHFCKWLAASG